MFTGIIETIASITDIRDQPWGRSLTLESPIDTSEIKIGASMAINGVCLTVTKIEGKKLSFDVVQETLRCSNLGELSIGSKVNLEQSLKYGQRVDGHFVSGHVDATVTLLKINQGDGSVELVFEKPKPFAIYIVKKGSIVISGVSLTVGEVNPDSFSVYIVPHTASVTTLGSLAIGARANLEIDMLARYVAEQMLHRDAK